MVPGGATRATSGTQTTGARQRSEIRDQRSAYGVRAGLLGWRTTEVSLPRRSLGEGGRSACRAVARSAEAGGQLAAPKPWRRREVSGQRTGYAGGKWAGARQRSVVRGQKSEVSGRCTGVSRTKVEHGDDQPVHCFRVFRVFSDVQPCLSFLCFHSSAIQALPVPRTVFVRLAKEWQQRNPT